MLYGKVLDIVERAVAREAYGDALVAALEAWRERRLPRLADLIDVLGMRRSGSRPASTAAWCDAAAIYDPLAVEPLLATFRSHLPYSDAPRRREVAARCAEIEQPILGTYGAGELARAIYVASWPDDPRVAHALLDWYEQLDLQWPTGGYGQPYPEGVAALRAVFARIYPSFARLADARHRERLEVLAQRPPGRQKWTRAVQVEAAVAALAVLDELIIPPVTGDELARFDALIEGLGGAPLRAGPPRGRPSFTPDEMWRAIAEAPDDDGPRMALADQLIERGDPRGLMFAHQLGTRRPGGRDDISLMARRHWTTWLGEDLARLLLRKRCELVRGMLDTVTVGRDSPGYLFDAAIDHRELLVVRRVFPNRIHPPHYGRFVASLPRVRVVGVAGRGILDALVAEAKERLAQLTALHWLGGSGIGELVCLAPHAPGIVTIAAPHMPTVEQQGVLHRAFPRLASFEVQSAP
jgi:uncharacterized protein (TIGR02996 family)